MNAKLGELLLTDDSTDDSILFARRGDGRPNTPHKIPLSAKIAVALFLTILVPVYLHTYGPTNFLWFCDAALVLPTIGMWWENSLLISMCAVGILLPQIGWLVDFGGRLLGFHGLGLTSYVFDAHLSRFTRGLSLFHGWLPWLLVWLLFRVGYNRKALSFWTAAAAVIGLLCYLFTPPARATPADPNLPININYLYGFDSQQPQHWMNHLATHRGKAYARLSRSLSQRPHSGQTYLYQRCTTSRIAWSGFQHIR